MIQHARFTNSRFTSNSYILYKENEDSVWIVDPGDAQQILEWMYEHGKENAAGILLTHTHFDHFYGANDILLRFPSCRLYVSGEYGRKGLSDFRQNGSLYSEFGIVSVDGCVNIKYYNEQVILWQDEAMKVLSTPGHSDDSVCLLVDGLLLTGDTLIKDVRTVTKLRGGSVEKLEESIKIFSTLKGNNIQVMPGHGDEFELDNYDLNKINNNPLNTTQRCQQ